MKKQAGFTLVELIVATGVTAVLLSAAVLSFRDSTKANSTVTQKSDMSDNMRSGLNLITQDLIQTGTGIPTGGISIPNTVNASGCNVGKPVNRPPTSLSLTFNGPNSANPGCNVILPAIEPGNSLGPTITSPDGTKGPATDVLSIMYVDNTLSLDAKQINGTGCPAGAIAANGNTITFDSGCVTIGAAGIPVNVGDLIMIYNNNGNCLQEVSAVSGQTLTFNASDPYNLNMRTGTETAGTIKQLQNLTGGVPNGTYPVTSATRIWMVTYYLAVPANDSAQPELMRELNFNAPQAVAEVFENLQFTFNFDDGTSPAPVNQTLVPVTDNENQIRSVNVYLGARTTSTTAGSGQYVRTNLATQVALRSMAYFNTYK